MKIRPLKLRLEYINWLKDTKAEKSQKVQNCVLHVPILGDSQYVVGRLRGAIYKHSKSSVDLQACRFDIDGATVCVYFYDLNYHMDRKLKSGTRYHYRGANSALFCFDVSNSESFTDLDIWIHDIERYTSQKVLSLSAIIGITTQSELPRQVSFEEATIFAKDIGCAYYESNFTTDTDDLYEFFQQYIKTVALNSNITPAQFPKSYKLSRIPPKSSHSLKSQPTPEHHQPPPNRKKSFLISWRS